METTASILKMVTNIPGTPLPWSGKVLRYRTNESGSHCLLVEGFKIESIEPSEERIVLEIAEGDTAKPVRREQESVPGIALNLSDGTQLRISQNPYTFDDFELAYGMLIWPVGITAA